MTHCVVCYGTEHLTRPCFTCDTPVCVECHLNHLSRLCPICDREELNLPRRCDICECTVHVSHTLAWSCRRCGLVHQSCKECRSDKARASGEAPLYTLLEAGGCVDEMDG